MARLMPHMSSGTFFRLAALGPLLGLAIAAALAPSAAPLPDGWFWLYPGSIVRGLVVYGLLAAWLWTRIPRRPIEEVERLVWWVPVLYVGLGWLFVLGPALARGGAKEFFDQHRGAILARTGVHLAVGFGYVALVLLAARFMRDGGGFTDAPAGRASEGE